MAKPPKLMITLVSNRVLEAMRQNPNANLDAVIEEVVNSKEKYASYDWKSVKADILDNVESLMEAPIGESQKKKANVVAPPPEPVKLSAPLKLKIKGKADVELLDDKSVVIKGGKKLGIKCDEDSEPFLEELEDGRKRGGCKVSKP